MPIANLPQHSKAYIFGSVLRSASPGDLDLLIVYDGAHCPPNDAYQCHNKTCEILKSITGLPIHLTLLSNSEEYATKFIHKTGAIPLEDVITLSNPLPTATALYKLKTFFRA